MTRNYTSEEHAIFSPAFICTVSTLQPLGKSIAEYMINNNGITAKEAMLKLATTGNTLTRQICNMEQKGLKIHRHKVRDNRNKKNYTIYSFTKRI